MFKNLLSEFVNDIAVFKRALGFQGQRVPVLSNLQRIHCCPLCRDPATILVPRELAGFQPRYLRAFAHVRLIGSSGWLPKEKYVMETNLLGIE